MTYTLEFSDEFEHSMKKLNTVRIISLDHHDNTY